MMDNNFNIEKESDVSDIDATVEAIRVAWHCIPEYDLSELLDSIMPAPMCEMTNKEILEALNEFIMQNA